MAKLTQLDREQRLPASPESPLTPELRRFIDRVIVPILVRDYASGIAQEKQIAERTEGAASVDSMTVAPEVEVAR